LTKEPFVSIIILNYNGREFLEGCLGSVLKTDYRNFEVIFVDNGSTDGSVEYIEKRFGNDPRLKIIRNERNLGFSGGNNVGIRHAKGEYIVLLNNDTIVEPDWLRKLVDVMEVRRDIGIAQPAILFLDTKKIQTLGNLVDKLLMLVKPLGYDRTFPGKMPRILKVTFPLGACLIIRRETLRKVGLFDEKFLIYHDDMYWGFLCWLAGYKAATILGARIYHKGRATISKFKRGERIYYDTISRVAMIIKTERARVLLFRLLLFIMLWTVYIFLKSVREKAPRYVKRLVDGYIWSLKNIAYVLTQRKLIRRRIGELRHRVLASVLLPNPIVFERIERRILSKINRLATQLDKINFS